MTNGKFKYAEMINCYPCAIYVKEGHSYIIYIQVLIQSVLHVFEQNTFLYKKKNNARFITQINVKPK